MNRQAGGARLGGDSWDSAALSLVCLMAFLLLSGPLPMFELKTLKLLVSMLILNSILATPVVWCLTLRRMHVKMSPQDTSKLTFNLPFSHQ